MSKAVVSVGVRNQNEDCEVKRHNISRTLNTRLLPKYNYLLNSPKSGSQISLVFSLMCSMPSNSAGSHLRKSSRHLYDKDIKF